MTTRWQRHDTELTMVIWQQREAKTMSAAKFQGPNTTGEALHAIM